MTEKELGTPNPAKNLARAIPDESFKRLVDTACDVFEQSLSPLTETTSGLGRLIKAKFDKYHEVEQMAVAEAIKSARQKVRKRKRKTSASPKPRVILRAIDSASIENDVVLRELWINLLATEFVDASIHPKIVTIMEQLDSVDAHQLAKITERHERHSSNTLHRAMKYFSKITATVTFNIPDRLFYIVDSEGRNFTYDHLYDLNLIKWDNGFWYLTYTGEAFIQAVSEPESDEESS